MFSTIFSARMLKIHYVYIAQKRIQKIVKKIEKIACMIGKHHVY